MTKRHCEPLTTAMFNIAIPQMKGYWSDLSHDVIRLITASPGDEYVWAIRESGTEMRPLLPGGKSALEAAKSIQFVVPHLEYYHIVVTRKYGGGMYAEGTMERIEL